ncbi:group 1 truncated hemoglobin [Solemya pervernicosa gill symbiont]|uniref:Group 1 truncated hemoglobin n=2 Tax=Gammaproteobacteria incertae sedis TaxID=118884 RepID=A0A1T2L3S7_9GAMM|nr:group 1 truncated hemoglobin [Candidatus Reidiella endopervernicosa]OOZ39596.1 group 1 truncated hemoglobin [Solemya pervernicosa gill symbiont]QKQ27847.1 group 1 truncated hemoglobin [Candidatus Reidiella endopervernicosa]
MSTLYERLGGEKVIDAAVDLFYNNVMADERINYFFENTDMARQRGHQKKFLSFAFGGLPNYSGRGMREAHAPLVKKLGLNDSHFDAVIENLGAALQALNVPAELIGEAASIAESIRDDVLCR